MTDTNDKLRALFLAALMVMSVFAMTVALSGSAAANFAESDAHQELDSGDTYWQGQELYVQDGNQGLGADHELRIRRVTDDGDIGGLVDQFALSSGTPPNTTFETDDLDGFYVIVNETGGVIDFNDGDADNTSGDEQSQVTQGEFEVAVQSLSAEFDEDEVPVTAPGTATIELTSNRATYSVNISADGLDEGDLEEIFNQSDDNNFDDSSVDEDDDESVVVTVGSSEEIEANFTEFEDAGEYTFDLEVNDSTASASASLEVQEEDVQLNFAQGVITQEAGDVAAITISLEDTSEGYLYVGGEDVNYLERVHFSDEGDDNQVTILMNTWRAGNATNNAGGTQDTPNASAYGDDGQSSGNTFWTLDDSDDEIDGVERYNSTDFGDGTVIDIDNDLSTPLEAGDYGLTLTAANDEDPSLDSSNDIVYEDEEDVATLDLTDGSVDDIQLMVAPGDHDATGLDDDDLEALLEDSTAADDVATGDLVVAQVEASGIYGYLLSEPDDDVAASVGGLNGVGAFLNVTQTNEAGNRDPKEVDWAQAAGDESAGVYTVPSENTFYLVMDTDTVDEFEDDDVFEVEFRRGDEDEADSPSPYVDDEEEESVVAEFSLSEPDAEFDNMVDDELQVEQDEEATVSGTTNVAPGSELNIRLRRTGDNPFLESQTVEVAEDGTVEATFDTSDIAVDTTFTATIRQGGTAISDEEDGVIVEATTPTPTTEPPETTTEPPETTTEPPETTTEPPETTTAPPETETESPGQPGFGVAIAIVALLGAALLALRRRD